MISPGATLGMLGGGQLGRMFTMAAHSMGYRVVVFDPDPDSPAGLIADQHLHAAYTDSWALDQLANTCAVITTEFENVPADTLRYLEKHCWVRPSAQVLALTQDRIREKNLITQTGLPTAPFRVVQNLHALSAACNELTPPYIIKRSSLGYDGKGQILVDDPAAVKKAFHALGEMACVLEKRVDLALEISVILGRSLDGTIVCFPVAENIHHNGILHMTLAPARAETRLAHRAIDMASNLAHALDYCGVMAVEFFVTRDGELLVNEIAPRPHNSGHYTLDACVTSQFEQQVRMICGLPAGEPRLLSPIVMVNLLGDLWDNEMPQWDALLQHPNTKLHLYGKLEARYGRKMGHFCYLQNNLEMAVSTARDILCHLSRHPKM